MKVKLATLTLVAVALLVLPAGCGKPAETPQAAALEVMFNDTKDESLKTRTLADLEKALAINPTHPASLALKARLSK